MPPKSPAEHRRVKPDPQKSWTGSTSTLNPRRHHIQVLQQRGRQPREILGLVHINTATRWTDQAGAPGSAYAAEVSRRDAGNRR
jgi:hypothetical protein